MSSSRVRHLNNAPIKEALIDIRVSQKTGVNLESLRPAVEQAKEEYPIEKKSKLISFLYDMEEEKAKSSEPLVRGYALWNREETQVVQFRLDGFTFNRVKEYQTWEDLYLQATKWWDLYVSVMKPVEVTRLSVKYINRILLPDADYPVYLTRPPARPLGIKGTISQFLYQVTVNTEPNITAVITQAVEPNWEDGKVPVLLDIDVSQQVNLEPKDTRIGSSLAELRLLKNDIFFENLTEEAIKLCS
jgi:uncharacterized protein (TIGR04255 family)